MAGLAKVADLSAWPDTRKSIGTAIKGVLGSVPKRSTDLQVKTIDELDCGSYVRKRVNYFVSEWERVSAWLLEPNHTDDRPGVVCCHDTFRGGKEEPAGLAGDPMLAFAKYYAERGYTVLAPDCVTAGERISSGLSAFDTTSFYKEHPRMSALGKMLFDHMRGLDVLETLSTVDPSRLGVIGHGLGGTNSLLLAAMDERVHACVASGALTDFDPESEHGKWAGELNLNLLPKFTLAQQKGEEPFTWAEVIAMVAPNPTLIVAGDGDPRCIPLKSCEAAVKEASSVFKMLGAGMAISCESHPDGSEVTWDVIASADDWFDRWL